MISKSVPRGNDYAAYVFVGFFAIVGLPLLFLAAAAVSPFALVGWVIERLLRSE